VNYGSFTVHVCLKIFFLIVRNGQVIGTTIYNFYYRTLNILYILNSEYIPVAYCDVHKNENWCFSLFPANVDLKTKLKLEVLTWGTD
jgi:hypothetical protein